MRAGPDAPCLSVSVGVVPDASSTSVSVGAGPNAPPLNVSVGNGLDSSLPSCILIRVCHDDSPPPCVFEGVRVDASHLSCEGIQVDNSHISCKGVQVDASHHSCESVQEDASRLPYLMPVPPSLPLMVPVQFSEAEPSQGLPQPSKEQRFFEFEADNDLSLLMKRRRLGDSQPPWLPECSTPFCECSTLLPEGSTSLHVGSMPLRGSTSHPECSTTAATPELSVTTGLIIICSLSGLHASCRTHGFPLLFLRAECSWSLRVTITIGHPQDLLPHAGWPPGHLPEQLSHDERVPGRSLEM